MNKKYGFMAAATLSALFSFAAAATVFAASVVLTNGGLGQIASNPQSFGLAVCNGGAKTITQSAPLSVTANGQTMSLSSAASIAPGVCEYSYVNYNQLGMTAGQTYAVGVTIDPNHTVISNANNQAIYTVTVPGTASVTADAGASATAGSTNFLATIGSAFANFFIALKNLF